MAQPEPKKIVDQVLKLVNQLPPDEQEQLRLKLNSKSKAERWQALCNKVQSQCKDLPPLSEDDIVADLRELRKEMMAERAQSGN